MDRVQSDAQSYADARAAFNTLFTATDQHYHDVFQRLVQQLEAMQSRLGAAERLQSQLQVLRILPIPSRDVLTLSAMDASTADSDAKNTGGLAKVTALLAQESARVEHFIMVRVS